MKVQCVTEKPKTQQEFLRQAMVQLDMTRDQFAERIGTKKRALDNWLLSSNSSEYRSMPEMAWKFIREILENDKKSA
ncbi:MAG: transcriptional regulator [Janthinobacterium lividum]